MSVRPGKLVVSVAAAIAALLSAVGTAHAGPFVVTDADFVSDVYQLRYYTRTNQLVKNGVAMTLDSTPLDDLFLTNKGNTGRPAWEYYGYDGETRYLQAPGAYGGFGGGTNSTWNTSAAATMGWDFSAVSRSVATVEILPRHILGQFDQWVTVGIGDNIYGEVATPASFGAGPYTTLYSHTGGTVAYTYDARLLNVTSSLSSSWLTDPGLLELKFGYELVNTDIPGRHIELFRDDYISQSPIDGFMVRVTLAEGQAVVPEPASLSLLALAGLGLLARRRRRRA